MEAQDAISQPHDTPPAFLFDLDGTLIDSVYLHVLAWHEALERAGKRLSVWRIHLRVGMSGGLLVNALVRETGGAITREDAALLQKWHAEAFLKFMPQVRPLPGAVELLNRLAALGVRYAIATGGIREYAEVSLRLLGLRPEVPVITRKQVRRAKPDPDVFSPLVDLATLNGAGIERLERHWGVVFQGNALLSGRSVETNIALPLREVQHMDESTISRRAREALREVALDLEEDLDLIVDQLSGGMAKRVVIARALTMDPILILYDEPTTGLDPLVAEQIQLLIESMHSKKTATGFPRTSVFITHDKDMLCRLQPRIIMLDGEHIVFDGSYGDFQNSDSPIIRPYFNLMPRLHSRTPGTAQQI